jgi:NADPH:quinone reductase-like Zn-dependent oxidoreductase
LCLLELDSKEALAIMQAEQKTANVKTIPQPDPSPDEVLVQVHTVALKPIDSLYVANPLDSTGRVVGSDFAGTIASIGQAVPASCGLHLEDGLWVSCKAHAASMIVQERLQNSSFVPGIFVWRVPEHMRFEESSTVSLCRLTAAQAVYHRLGLETPFRWKHEVGSDSGQQDDNRSRLRINSSSLARQHR